jgi:GNAT superfamily N-acetyltransferase
MTQLKDGAILRVAQPADVAEIQRVRHSVTENRLSDPSRVPDSAVLAHMGELGCGWVVQLSNAQIAAFAFGRFDGNVWALFTDPAFEGCGYGGALHQVMVQWMFAQGQPVLNLSTEIGSKAEGFYARRGWVKTPPHPAGEVRMLLSRE